MLGVILQQHAVRYIALSHFCFDWLGGGFALSPTSTCLKSCSHVDRDHEWSCFYPITHLDVSSSLQITCTTPASSKNSRFFPSFFNLLPYVHTSENNTQFNWHTCVTNTCFTTVNRLLGTLLMCILAYKHLDERGTMLWCYSSMQFSTPTLFLFYSNYVDFLFGLLCTPSPNHRSSIVISMLYAPHMTIYLPLHPLERQLQLVNWVYHASSCKKKTFFLLPSQQKSIITNSPPLPGMVTLKVLLQSYALSRPTYDMFSPPSPWSGQPVYS